MKRISKFIKLFLLICTATYIPLSFSEDCVNCEAERISLSCTAVDQAAISLRLKHQEIQKKYANLDRQNDYKTFEAESAQYLALHQQMKKCPDFKEQCPIFHFREYMNGKEGIIKTTQDSSYGPNCIKAKPSYTFSDGKNKDLALQLGSSIQIKVESDCGDGKGLSFVAYKEGLLVMSRAKGTQFSSHTVARRIPLGSTEAKVESLDGKNLRVVWTGKNKASNKWIELDADTMTFKESNFMKTDQLNSGKCKVVQQDSPTGVCESMRKQLLKHVIIKSKDEYECKEHVPVIEGVASKVSRG